MEQVDREILKGLQSGDQRAYNCLIRLYFQPLTIYAKSILLNFEQSKDIIQDLFIKLWHNREQLEISISLKPYLYRMVHNACIDFIRKERSTKVINTLSYDDLQIRMQIFEIKDEGHFFDMMFSDELDHKLQMAIEQLPPQCKEIFILARFEQLSYPEISQKLSISLSTVKTQMVRAMQKLKEDTKKFLE